MIPPPPTSTLFPYTTLFRSHFEIEHAHAESLLTLISPAVTRTDHDAGTSFFFASKVDHGVRDRRIALNRISTGPEEQVARLDRKSTRLNSSHQIISYAVFCL